MKTKKNTSKRENMKIQLLILIIISLSFSNIHAQQVINQPLKIANSGKSVLIKSRNNHLRFDTDNGQFYFNKQVQIGGNGKLCAWQKNLLLHASTSNIENIKPFVEIISSNDTIGVKIRNITKTESYGSLRITDNGFSINSRRNDEEKGKWPESHLLIKTNGNVGIGTANPQSKLSVNGIIQAVGIVVEDVINSDFVFEDNYKLRSIEELDKFIEENNHLPDVLPASETVKGVELAAFSNILLQKIEELTLYTIEQQKQLSLQLETINKFQEEIDKLKTIVK